MAFTLQAFKTDSLASDITDSATSMTLTTGAFGTPTGEQMLVVDYDVAAKREIIKCAIDGTAITSIDRAQDGTSAVAHSSGAKVIMAFVPSHYTSLTDGTSWNDAIVAQRHLDANLKAGWHLLATAGTRVGDTSFTVSGDITAYVGVGTKFKLTDTTTKYAYVTAATYGAPNTTITVVNDGVAVIAGNPSNIYYSNETSPVGFPANSATFSPLGAGYAEITSSFTTSTNGSDVDVNGLAITVNVPTGKRVRLTAYCSDISSSAAGGGSNYVRLKEGATLLQSWRSTMAGAVYGYSPSLSVILSPTAGAHTYKVAVNQGAAGTLTYAAGATAPAYLLAEII